MILWLKLGIVSKSLQKRVGILETYRLKSIPWFDQECSELAIERKQAKLLWLQNPNGQIAGDFVNIRCDTCRTFKKKKNDYRKAKVNKLQVDSKNKNILNIYNGINGQEEFSTL